LKLVLESLQLKKISKLYKVSVDEIINLSTGLPKETTIGNEAEVDQLHLLHQLDEDDKVTVYKIIDTMLTKKKFKDFFNKNVATL
jgi:hypothetical protein